MELKVTILSQGDSAIMSVAGEIDLYTAPKLHSALTNALAESGPLNLIVDMTNVEFCDSTGMNVLLAAQRRAREVGGDVQLASPRPAIRKVLEVTGLSSVFTVLEGPAAVAGQ